MSFGKQNKNSSSSSNGTYSGTDNTNQTSNYSTAPTNPEWVTNGATGLYSGAQALAGANPQSYIAGPSSLQNTAATNAGNMNGVYWNFNTDADTSNRLVNASAPTTSGTTASTYLTQEMNPYESQVINPALAAFDNQAGQTQATNALQMAKSGAFGGSGAGIDQALTNGQLALARGQLQSGLLNQGYTTALGAATNDANNAQSANNLNAQLAQQEQAQQLAAAQNLGNLSAQQTNTQATAANTQAGIGATLQQIAQQRASAPLDLQSWLAQMFAGSQPGLFQGQTGTQNTTGTESQSGTQSSNGTGNSSGFNFGFKLGGQ